MARRRVVVRRLYAAVCVVLGGLSLGLLWFACMQRPIQAVRPSRGSSRRKEASRYDDEDGEEDESVSRGRLQLAAGFLSHWTLAARAAVQRRLADRQRQASRVREPSVGATPRREPRFQQAPASSRADPYAFDDEFDGADEQFDDYEASVAPVEPPRPAAPARTHPVALRQPPILRIPDSWKFGRRAAARAEPEPEREPEEEEFEAEIPVPAPHQFAPSKPPAPAARAVPARPAAAAARAGAASAPASGRARPGTQRPAAPGGPFQLPPLDLLSPPPPRRRDPSIDKGALEQNARLLEGVLEDFGVRGEIINVRPGPVVTLYELEPAPGIKSSRVISLADDIARSMSAIAARVAVIPGKNAIGIELPNGIRETVYLRELLGSGDFDSSKAKLPMALGKTIGGEPVVADIAKMPHLLVAGTTGSGKSVAINTMILGLVYRLTPDQCRLIMIDPKMLELSVYDGIPHL
jgi:S-DNA-T family DNA segregation ATPase FtsK/SpoIIIE